MAKLLIDFDALLFKATCAVEKRSVIIKNKITSEEFKASNRTEFFGGSKKKIGGILEKLNTENNTEFNRDDFIVEDVQEVGDFSEAAFIINALIKQYQKALNVKSWTGYIGGEGNFRVDRCELIPYKQNREDLIKPLFFDEMKNYMINHLGAVVCNGIETDDMISMIAYDSYLKYKKSRDRKDLCIAVVQDKDFKGNPAWLFYPDQDFEQWCSAGIGSLYNDEGKIDGYGAAWKYFQIASNDTSDGYSANYHSDIKWGPMSAYKALQGCVTHKDYWTKIVEIYKHLYPKPKLIINHRGDEREVTWLSMLKEIVLFVHLHRWENDFLDVEEILKNMGIDYE